MPRAGYDEVVLLTGFPSFRARRMCAELVKDNTLVHAVVHPKFADDARAALDALTLDERRRVVLLEGDAAAMDMGLSGAELRALGPQVDRIHHCVQVNYLGVDRETAEHVNVGAAREVLEVAELCPNLRCLVVHSSASVSGDRTGIVHEQELDAGQGFRNVVEETLARAERMMRQAMPTLPIAVLRPGIVVGDSQSGEVDRLDGPYLLILLMLASPPDFALPLPGKGDVPLNMVPIDYVTRAALAIGRDPRAVGRTFHLVDPAPLSARRVFELVARAGGRRLAKGFIPANLTKALLRAPGLERIAKSPRAFLEALATPVTYDARNAAELLADTGIACPPFESYVDQLVLHVEARLRDRQRRREADVHDPLG